MPKIKPTTPERAKQDVELYRGYILKMVEDLLASPLAAQDVFVSVFANDVTTVQTAEIGTMRQMLDNL